MATSSTIHVEKNLSNEIKTMLKEFANLEFLEQKGKIRCKWSGHEMPCNVGAVKSYTEGKKFQKLKALNTYNYDKYKEYIVQSIKKRRQHQLFCKLTERHLNNNPVHIQKHIEGRRFQKAYKRWEQCQLDGTKFVANPGRRRKHTESDMSSEDQYADEGDDGNDDDSDVDSLSDLYPAKDFGEENDQEEENEVAGDEKETKDTEDSSSDFDFDVMGENQDKNVQSTTKRKADSQDGQTEPEANGSSVKKRKKFRRKIKKKKRYFNMVKKGI